MRWRATACFVLLLLGLSRPASAQSDRLDSETSAVARMADAQGHRKRLGLTPEYERIAGLEAVKVAVLDYGFAGVGQGRPYLPAGAEVVEHYDPAFIRRFNLGDPDYRAPL